MWVITFKINQMKNLPKRKSIDENVNHNRQLQVMTFMIDSNMNLYRLSHNAGTVPVSELLLPKQRSQSSMPPSPPRNNTKPKLIHQGRNAFTSPSHKIEDKWHTPHLVINEKDNSKEKPV